MESHFLAILLLVLIIYEAQGYYSYEAILARDEALVSNITHQSLRGKISEEMEAMYLHTFDHPLDTYYTGYVFGTSKRGLICLPVRLSHKQCPSKSVAVIFEYVPESPTTTLTKEALNKLYSSCPKVKRTSQDTHSVQIVGHQLQVSKSEKPLNILGADFFTKTKCQVQFLEQNRARPYMVLIFPGDEDYIQNNQNDGL